MIPEDMEILEAALAEALQLVMEEMESNNDYMYEGEELVDFETMSEEEQDEEDAMYEDLDDFDDYEVFEDSDDADDSDDDDFDAFVVETDYFIQIYQQFLMLIRKVFQ